MSNTGYVKVDKEIVLRACSNFEEYFKEYKEEIRKAYLKYVEEYNAIQMKKWFPKPIDYETARYHFGFYGNQLFPITETQYFNKIKFSYNALENYDIQHQVQELAKLGNVLYLNAQQAQFVNMWKERCKV